MQRFSVSFSILLQMKFTYFNATIKYLQEDTLLQQKNERILEFFI